MDNFDPFLGGIHVVDIAVAVIMIGSGLLGLIRGLTRELFSIFAWIGAAVAAYYAFPHVQPFVFQIIEIELLADLIAGAAVFIVALIVLSLIFAAIGDRLKRNRTGMLDRSLGLLYGLVRGGLIIVIVYLMFSWFVPQADQPPWLESARSMPSIKYVTAKVEDVVPDETWQWLAETLDREPPRIGDDGPPPDPDLETQQLSDPPTEGGEPSQPAPIDNESGGALDNLLEQLGGNQDNTN